MGLFGKKQEAVFSVPELSCGHCEMKVGKLLSTVAGVVEVKASSADKRVTLVYKGSSAPSLETVTAALGDSGYTATEA